ncbi:MiaB/RimO family radical SAM methylthiotransferase [Glacieibacterium sp.]|uniref:MiaB/RimO family radical SAM methylthiotransferase n=1 Tax=Glacieibacterium sp. TaxID=2860237 RepID=UPI003B002490
MSEVLGFGCRLNLAESAVLAGLSADSGLVIVNTCAVTAESVRQARQAIRRTARARPGVRIVVTGCAAEVEPEQFAMPEVAAVIGRAAKFLPSSYGDSPPAPLLPGAARTRAFVPVQNGCDHACTFCIIARARGPSTSEPASAVVERIAALSEAGTQEVVLTGVDLTSYADGAATLGSLVQRILRETALPRLRISSIDSIEADDRLLDAIATQPRLMPQLHLSLQSGDDLILKRMRRRHSRAQAIEFCAALRTRRPEIAFAADFITGFPTETEAMFERTAALVEECDLTQLHVFAYSPRPGTPAARMPQVPPAVARTRAARLRALGEARTAAALTAALNRPQRILVERSGQRGRTEAYLPAHLSTPAAPGSIVTATATHHAAGILEFA